MMGSSNVFLASRNRRWSLPVLATSRDDTHARIDLRHGGCTRMKRVLTIAILLVVAVYAADYLSVKFHIPGKRQARDSIEVERDFAIHRKDRRVEYTRTIAEQQECVVSLFPHFGDPPCWYLRGHTEQHIDVDPGPARPWFDLP